MPKFIFILLALVFSSCATVFNKKRYLLTIKSDGDHVRVDDNVYEIPAKVNVMRSKEDLKVTVMKDTVKKDFLLKSSLDPFFVFGNLGLWYLSPAGYLIDLTNKKRFYYGWGAELRTTDTSSVYEPEPAQLYRELQRFANKKFFTKAGQFNFTASLPYANAFYFKPEGEPQKSGVGFFGIGTGLEYYYKDNAFLSFSATAALAFPVPVPVPLDRAGPYESVRSTYFSVTNNKKLNRWSFGYGLNFSSNIWESSNDSLNADVIKVNHAMGITLNGQWQLNRFVYIGLTYRPTLLRFPDFTFSYGHLLSLDFTFKVPLRRPRRAK